MVRSQFTNATVSIAFTLCGGPGILLLLIPWWATHFRIPATEPAWQRAALLVLIAMGLAPLLESIWRFVVVGRGTLVPAVPTQRLVISGFYAYVRNPMYLGVLTAMGSEAMIFRSPGLLEEFICVWLSIELFVRFYEEHRLSRAYPEEYALYRRNVRRWLPRLTAWHPPPQTNISAVCGVQ